MLNLDLIKEVLMVAMASSVITTSFVQKIKEAITFKNSNRLVIISFIVSMTIGTLFSLSFSDIGFKYCLWSGLVSFIGADTLYKMFEDKIFKSFSEIAEKNKVIVDEENIIK